MSLEKKCECCNVGAKVAFISIGVSIDKVVYSCGDKGCDNFLANQYLGIKGIKTYDVKEILPNIEFN